MGKGSAQHALDNPARDCCGGGVMRTVTLILMEAETLAPGFHLNIPTARK
jgi:hypothetical protein